MSKKDTQAIDKAMEDFEKSVKAGKVSQFDSELIHVAQSQKELIGFRDSMNLPIY